MRRVRESSDCLVSVAVVVVCGASVVNLISIRLHFPQLLLFHLTLSRFSFSARSARGALLLSLVSYPFRPCFPSPLRLRVIALMRIFPIVYVSWTICISVVNGHYFNSIWFFIWILYIDFVVVSCCFQRQTTKIMDARIANFSLVSS